MISFVSGTVHHASAGTVEVLTGELGYRIFCTAETVSHAAVGAPIELYTHTHVREDALDLFGFETREQLELFERLITVSGIGPRTALNVLTLASPNELRAAIARGDAAVLTKVSGIGKKTAERIVLELSGKVTAPQTAGGVPAKDSDADVIDALVGLGYSLADARSYLAAIPADVTGTDARIKAVLKRIAQ